MTLNGDGSVASSVVVQGGAGGEIAAALNVTGSASNGGAVNIGIVDATEESKTIAIGDIKIFEYGKMTVNTNATLSLRESSVSGEGMLNVAGGTVNASGPYGLDLDLDLSATNVSLSNDGTLATARKQTIIGAAKFNADAQGVGSDVLAGAYTIRNNGKLVLDNLTIDAANVVSANNATAGQVSTLIGGMLVVKDTLTLGGAGTVTENVNVKTQSLAAAQGLTDVTFNDGTLTFSDGSAATDSASASAMINTNLITSGTAQIIVGYTEDSTTTPSTILGTTTLGAENSLTISNADGLNILGGATLDVSDGTLTVVGDGFAHLDPDEVKQPSVLGEVGLGTLIVDNSNLGFSAIEGDIREDGGSLTAEGVNTNTLVMTSNAENQPTITTKELTIGSYAYLHGTVVTDVANFNGVTFIGSSEDAIVSRFSFQKTTVSGFVMSDPNFDGDPTLSEATSAVFGDVSINNSGFIAAQNSLMAFGTSDATLFTGALELAVKNGQMVWGPTSGGTTAAMGFYKAVSLPDTALLHVDGSLKTVSVGGVKQLQDASGTMLIDNTTGTVTADGIAAGLVSGNVTFAANSLALIDAVAFQDPSANTVIMGTGAGIGDLNVDASSKLLVVGGISG